MKKLLVIIGAIFICTFAIAQTISIDWKVDNNTYAQNTCEYGGTLTVPSTPPTKYGYTFQGWGNYIKLEYIESTGAQYIDTGIKPDSNTTIKIKYLMTSIQGTHFPFGGRYFASATNAGEGVFRTHGVSVNRVGFGYAEGTNSSIGSEYDFPGVIYDLYFNKNEVFINNTLVATLPRTVFSGKNNIYIFGVNTNGNIEYLSSMKLYSYQIYDDNRLIQNLIPAKKDDLIGMYDTVTGIFFTNAGVGEFIAGPVVGAVAE